MQYPQGIRERTLSTGKLVKWQLVNNSSRIFSMEYLPDYFEPWNRLAKCMPELVARHEMRQAVSQMPLLDHHKLKGYRQHRLAHLQLVIITSGYVWQEGDDGVTQHLPKCVAIPLWRISEQLGLKPVISHPDVCLANWKYTDKEGNIECLYLIPGGSSSEWFFKVVCFVELSFAKGLHTLQSILDGVSEDNKAKVMGSLGNLTVLVDDMKSALEKMHENLSADTFYNILMPFLGGWGGGSNPLPDGLIYEGISEEPVKLNGGSAAQSTTLQFLDILLGVTHQPDKQSFLNEMRNYMPPSHKQLLVDMENMPRTLRDMVTELEDRNLLTAYNTAIQAVTKFRNYHIQVVTKYVIVASRKKTERNNFESLASKGTGWTGLLPFLKELRNDTKKKVL